MQEEENKTEKSNRKLYLGAIIGLLVSLSTIFVQYLFDNQAKQVQLYLDEKKDFTLACDDFLRRYSQWHDLMDYCVYNDTLRNSPLAMIKNQEEFIRSYKTWRQDLDFSYSKIFLLSNNEFGSITMKISTELHNSLDSLISGNYNFKQKRQIQVKAENYFFKNWLQVAQEEIFKYNSGKRDQKSLKEFQEEQQAAETNRNENDRVDSTMYKSLSKANDFMRKQDSLNGRKNTRRMPSEQEFKQTLQELNNNK